MQAPITKAQIKAIHVALSRQGIEDGIYRQKLRLMFDVGSCKALSRQQATTLLKSLGLPAPKPARQARPRRATRTQGDNIIALPTPAQMQFISDLRREIAWNRHDGYQCWLRRYLGITRIRTSVEAARAIEGLKGVKRSQLDGASSNRGHGAE